MPKKPRISDAEKSLFRANMQGVKPLAKPVAPPQQSAPQKTYQKKPPLPMIHEASLLDAPSIYSEPLDPVYGENILQFARDGVQHKVLQRLKRREFQLNATLDLHGHNIEQAHAALHAFIDGACAQHFRYLLVIHGKGARGENQAPILKNKVNQWLRQYREVLAFCSATPREGGAGAVYVLLRSH